MRRRSRPYARTAAACGASLALWCAGREAFAGDREIKPPRRLFVQVSAGPAYGYNEVSRSAELTTPSSIELVSFREERHGLMLVTDVLVGYRKNASFLGGMFSYGRLEGEVTLTPTARERGMTLDGAVHSGCPAFVAGGGILGDAIRLGGGGGVCVIVYPTPVVDGVDVDSGNVGFLSVAYGVGWIGPYFDVSRHWSLGARLRSDFWSGLGHVAASAGLVLDLSYREAEE